MTAYLLDTHFLLWAAQDSPSLSAGAREILGETKNDILISVANIWEVVIKNRLGLPDFARGPGSIDVSQHVLGPLVTTWRSVRGRTTR